MPQRPKDKGTRAETAVVQWALRHGFTGAERLALSGVNDRGDVRLHAQRVMVQVKDGYTQGREPSDMLVQKWLAELEQQRENGGWQLGLLTHKRAGYANPDHWRWYLPGWSILPEVPYVQVQGYMIPNLLRGRAYGYV